MSDEDEAPPPDAVVAKRLVGDLFEIRRDGVLLALAVGEEIATIICLALT